MKNDTNEVLQKGNSSKTLWAILKNLWYATMLTGMLALGSCGDSKYSKVEKLSGQYSYVLDEKTWQSWVIDKEWRLLFSYPNLDQVRKWPHGFEVYLKRSQSPDYAVGLVSFEGREIIDPDRITENGIEIIKYIGDNLIIFYKDMTSENGGKKIVAVYDKNWEEILPLGEYDDFIFSGEENSNQYVSFMKWDKKCTINQDGMIHQE